MCVCIFGLCVWVGVFVCVWVFLLFFLTYITWQYFQTFQHKGLGFRVRGLGLGFWVRVRLVLGSELGLRFRVMNINDGGKFGSHSHYLPMW